MPNGKSLYSTFAGASAAEGKVQAAETAVKSIGDLMKGELQIMDWGQGQAQKLIGTVSEGISLTSTLFGGWEAKQEFETAKTGVQSQIARESYTGEDYESFIGTTEGKKYLESFAPEETWTFKEGTKYKFGEGKDRYSLGKGTISGIGEGAKYGVKADLSMYKEAAQAPPAAPSGQFYGEKKGFDLGDITGEKSIFAAGKEKLSNLFSKKAVSGAYDPTNMSEEARKMYEYQTGLDAPKTAKKSGKKTDMTVVSEEAVPFESSVLNFKSPVLNPDWYNPPEDEY